MKLNFKVGITIASLFFLLISINYLNQSNFGLTQSAGEFIELDNYILNGHVVKEGDEISSHTVGIFNLNTNGVCTGVIIGKTQIVTAAHYIHSRNSINDIEVRFGLNIYNNYKVINASAIYEGNYIPSPNLSDDDYALIILENQIPSGFKPVRILSQANQLHTNTNLWIAGFGISQHPTKDIDGDLKFGRVMVKNRFYSNSIFEISPLEQSGCHGDSGGPAFWVTDNYEWILVGIFLGSNIKTDKYEECSHDGIYIHGETVYYFNKQYIK